MAFHPFGFHICMAFLHLLLPSGNTRDLSLTSPPHLLPSRIESDICIQACSMILSSACEILIYRSSYKKTKLSSSPLSITVFFFLDKC